MLLFRKSGRFQIKILDFGLAKFSQTPSTQTLDQKGSFLGSIDYIAPEQIECLPLDARTDLYSLGCLFYFSLTQRPPFQGDSPATTMRNHLNGVVRDLKDIRPDIPKAVSSWIMRLISRRPEDRPATAAEAFRDFNFALEGVPRAASSSPIFPPSTAPTPSASPPIVAPPSTPIIVSEPARATAQTIQSGSPISQAPNTGIPQTVVPSTDNIPLARKATGSVPQSQEPSSSLKPQLIIGFVVILLAVILGVLFGTGIIGPATCAPELWLDDSAVTSRRRVL